MATTTERGMGATGAGGVGDAGEATSRRFADETGVVWTAELRRPKTAPRPGHVASPMILFWSDTRACLATLRSARALADLTEEDLRRHLSACLSG